MTEAPPITRPRTPWHLWVVGIVSLLLLLRRGLAHAVFLVSLAGVLVSMFHNFVLTPGLEIMGGPGPAAFSGAIVLVALLLVIYSRAQNKSGVLG